MNRTRQYGMAARGIDLRHIFTALVDYVIVDSSLHPPSSVGLFGMEDYLPLYLDPLCDYAMAHLPHGKAKNHRITGLQIPLVSAAAKLLCEFRRKGGLSSRPPPAGCS